jgi:predicted peptidase
MLVGMPSRPRTERARWATYGIVCALAIAVMAVRCATHRVMEIHPLGSTASPYGYVEYVPPIAGPRPLLLVLHGSGSRDAGHNPDVLIDRLPPLRDVAFARLFGRSSPLADEGVLIAAPQSPGAWDVAKLDAFLDHMFASRDIDRDRVYLTGLSMGGCGAWRYAAAHPERLAAVMPICGGCVQTGELAARLQTLPVRAFHAFDDEVVPNYESATWVSAIAAQRGGSGDSRDLMSRYPSGFDSTAVFDGTRLVWRPGTSVSADETLSLTEFALGGHNIWLGVYSEDASWRWMFAQLRGARAP